MTKNKILFADDDHMLGMILTKELTSYGYHVSFVENGEDAISKLNDDNYDLAILDIRMPKVDGFGVLKFIKKEKPEIKVIMLTAYADLKHQIMSEQGGAHQFLSKPYNLETLRFTIENLLK